MNLGKYDLHLMLSREARTARLFDAGGKLLLACECRNRTVNEAAPVNERDAPCPPGEFVLGKPEWRDSPPFGAWFYALLDAPGRTQMADNHRSGIGLHGGGSGLPNWAAPFQGWRPTRGCWRLQNEDLLRLHDRAAAAFVRDAAVYVTVAALFPGDTLVWDEAPDRELAEGE